jgi:hypothetical protein
MAQSTTYDLDVYQPRNPKASACYKCVENHFEELERAWDDVCIPLWFLAHLYHDGDLQIPGLRIYFLYDRKLLAKLSICGWKVINAYLKSAVPNDGAVPGASIAVQTYGDFQNFNPHLHAIVSDGCFLEGGSFRMAPGFMLEDLEEAFQYEVLKMLKKEGRINNAIIENMLSWHHSGFHVYIGDRIYPDDKTGLGNLARYIVRACFER